jgi:hypothetical protein
MIVKHLFLLPMDYKHRKNKKEFFAGRVERDIALSLPSSEELYDVVSEYVNILVFNSISRSFLVLV